MRIQRSISRRIELTAQEIYDLLVKTNDLPPTTNVRFEDDGYGGSIILLADTTYEQELAA